MKLTGSQMEELVNALLDVFDHNSLQQMLLFKMDVRLDNIVATHNGMRIIVFDLVQWAEQHARIVELIEAAVETRPANPKLSALYQELVDNGPREEAARADVQDNVQAPHFEHGDILKMHDLLLRVELASEDALQVLQGGMNLEFRTSLPSTGAPSQRLLNTLFVLNSTGELIGGEIPFENFLANAVHLSKARQESAELEKFLVRLRA